jgi:hypothetical protein
MSGVELDKYITSYYNRVEIRNACYYQGKATSNKIATRFNNGKSEEELSVFICDAMIIKDFEYEGKVLPCRNPTFKGENIQFYLLNQKQLFDYIVFRTILKKGMTSSIRSKGFLTLFLMEIVNGIYGSSFSYKLNELKRIYSIFPKGEGYEDLFKEAFEIIFIQNLDSLDVEDYVKNIPVAAFKDTSLLPFFVDKKQKHIIEIILNNVESMYEYKISDVELYIFKDCFETLFNELSSKPSYNSYSYSAIENLVYHYEGLYFNYPLRHLKAQYPLTTNFTYKNINGDESQFENGLHSKLTNKCDTLRSKEILYSTLAIFNSIAYYCNYTIKDKDSGKVTPRYTIPESKLSYIKIDQMALSTIIEEWICDNQYAKIGYRLSLSELKSLKINGVKGKDILAFKQWETARMEEYYDDKAKQLIEKRNQEARDRMEEAERLYGIGDYISPEEKKVQFDKLMNLNKIANEKFYSSVEEAGTSAIKTKDDTFSKFIRNLSTLETKVFSLLCQDNFDGADDAAWDKDELISNVIDKINTKSNKYLECNVIEDTEVIDKFINKILTEIE